MTRTVFIAAFLTAALLIDEGWCTVCTASTVPCVFPFYHQGEKYTTCIRNTSKDSAWCAHKVDENANVVDDGGWHWCDNNCEIITLYPTTTAPAKASSTTTANAATTTTTISTFSSSTTPFSQVKPTNRYHPDNSPGLCNCGVPNFRSDRIVGGQKTEIGEYPWQVALLRGTTAKSLFCGGALVTDRHVITAAHCCERLTPDGVLTVLGGTILKGNLTNHPRGAQLHPVSEIIKADYDWQTKQNDICVLKLAAPVDLYASPFIKPVCLPSAHLRVLDLGGQAAIVAGWGTKTFAGLHPRSSHLQDVTVQVHNPKTCGDITPEEVTDGQFCADMPEGGKDACQGDSGGPLITKDVDNNGAATLIGVVSWGNGCGMKNSPGMYSEVSYFLRNGWLGRALEGGKECPAPPDSDWVIRVYDQAVSTTEMASVTAAPKRTSTISPQTTTAQPASPQTVTSQPATGQQATTTQPASPQTTQPTGPQATTTQPAGPQATTTQPAGPQATTTQPAGPQATTAQPAGPQTTSRPSCRGQSQANIYHCNQQHARPHLVAYKWHDEIEDQDLCRLMCNHEGPCQYWSWQKKMHLCSLYKRDEVQFQPDEDFSSGQKNC